MVMKCKQLRLLLKTVTTQCIVYSCIHCIQDCVDCAREERV